MKSNKQKSPAKGTRKTFGSKRTVNPSQGPHQSREAQSDTSAFHHQDAQRRLGSFEGKGEHARTGNRGRQ